MHDDDNVKVWVRWRLGGGVQEYSLNRECKKSVRVITNTVNSMLSGAWLSNPCNSVCPARSAALLDPNSKERERQREPENRALFYNPPVGAEFGRWKMWAMGISQHPH